MKPIKTRVAYCGTFEYRFCGHSVFDELTGTETFLGVAALALLQRRLTTEERCLLDVMSLILTAADPRIWPLKVARLAAGFGAPEAGLAAANLCLIGSKLGPDTVHRTAAFLLEVQNAAGPLPHDEESLTAAALLTMKSHRMVPGFGVPGRSFDQRLRVLDAHLAAVHRTDLPFHQIKEAVVRAAKTHIPKAPPNVSLGLAASCLDMGFRPEDMGPLAHLLAMNAELANAVEGARNPASELQCLPDKAIRYVGPAPRTSPRKQKAETGRN